MKGGGISHDNFIRPISNARNRIDSEDECNSINFECDLQNLELTFLNYKINDVLEIVLGPEDTIQVKGVYGICGYVTDPESISIINCIKKGKKFKAIIINISSISCRVLIRNKVI